MAADEDHMDVELRSRAKNSEFPQILRMVMEGINDNGRYVISQSVMLA